MVRYTLAATLLLSAASVSSSFTPNSLVARHRVIKKAGHNHKSKTTASNMRRNLSTSTLYHDDDENKNTEAARSIQNLKDDVNKLGSAYLESISKAIGDDDEVDAYEAEMALKKRILKERSRTYEVTLPLNVSKENTNMSLGLTLCQVDTGLEFSDVDLDLDSLQYLSSADMSAMEKAMEMIDVSQMKQRLDKSFRGVIVSGVVKGGRAWNAGVRPGDTLRATSATVGDALWPKSTLNGVKSAISSRSVATDSVKLEFERSTVEVGSQYELTLTKPLGLQIQETDDGYVEVTGFTESAQKLARFAIKPGDRILAVDSAVGDRMWPVSTVEGVISSCTTHLPGQPIRMQFLRPYSSEAGTETQQADSSTTMAGAAVAADNTVISQQATKVASKDLLKRCREMLKRYSAENELAQKAKFSGKYAVPALVADKVLDAVAGASASLDAVTLSMVMNAYLSCRQPAKAIRAFEAAVGLNADGSDALATETTSGKDSGGALIANPDTLNLVTGSSLMRAYALLGDSVSVQRVLAALEGRSGVKFNGIESAEWPGTGVYGSIVPDTQCYNIALSAAAKSKGKGGIDAALELFRSMNEPRQPGRKPVKDLVSYNTIIGALAKHSRPDDAFSIFYEMKSAGVRPDKFTYTSLIQACVHQGDIQELLYDMREQGAQPDVVTFNSMIKSLCQRSQLTEAKKLVTEMELRGISPDSMTYGLLMDGLLKAGKPSTCLTLFETACANIRTAPLMENVHLYTTAISAAAAVGNHERAFELVSRMNAAGVKPNLKTLTALMGACLSSGKSQLAVDVFKRMDKPDGYAMVSAIRAMCANGDLSEASALLSEQRSGNLIMTGKQVVMSYQELLRSSLESEDFAMAKMTMTELLESGYIPSKATLLSIIEALGFMEKKRRALASAIVAPKIPDASFDFLLFVLDALRERNLPCDDAFYASVLRAGPRMGGLRRKIASLLAEARAATVDDAMETSEVNGEEPMPTVRWQDLVENYDELKVQLAEHEIQLPTLVVRMSSTEVRQVLSAEQRVTYDSPGRRGRYRRRKPVVQLAFNEPPSSS